MDIKPKLSMAQVEGSGTAVTRRESPLSCGVDSKLADSSDCLRSVVVKHRGRSSQSHRPAKALNTGIIRENLDLVRKARGEVIQCEGFRSAGEGPGAVIEKILIGSREGAIWAPRDSISKPWILVGKAHGIA